MALYYRSLWYWSSSIVVCALLTLPALIKNMAAQPKGVPIALKGTSFGLGRHQLGMFEDATCGFMVCFALLFTVVAMRQSMKRDSKEVDDSMYTTKDYSVEVRNPSPKLACPDQYRTFFSKMFGPVKAVTIALDNGDLLRQLSERRYEQTKLGTLKANDDFELRISKRHPQVRWHMRGLCSRRPARWR